MVHQVEVFSTTKRQIVSVIYVGINLNSENNYHSLYVNMLRSNWIKNNIKQNHKHKKLRIFFMKIPLMQKKKL